MNFDDKSRHDSIFNKPDDSLEVYCHERGVHWRAYFLDSWERKKHGKGRHHIMGQKHQHRSLQVDFPRSNLSQYHQLPKTDWELIYSKSKGGCWSSMKQKCKETENFH